jgi:predicted DCC family thiol-disulfide oxidoreductase YuxK
MKTLLQRLDEYWFAAAPAARLAALRILVGAFSLCYMGFHFFDFPGKVNGSSKFYAPVGVATLLPDPLPPSVFQVIVVLMLLANVAFLLGWRFRTTGPLFGGLLTFVLCYRNSWSMIYHSENLFVLNAIILGVSRAADVYSLDSLARSSSRPTGENPELSGWQYGWPIRLICVVTLLSYSLAGVAKVAGPVGWGWITGESLRAQVAFDALRKEFIADGGSGLFFNIYEHDALFWGMGIVTYLVELGALAALLHRRIAYWWVLGALMMHWGILAMMKITFEYPLTGIPFAAFLPVERLLPRRTRARVVLYDGWCGLCQGSRRWASMLDWFGSVSWVNFRDPQVRAAVPQLTDAQLEQEMWIVGADGEMKPGFLGWRHLLTGFPLTCVPALLLYVPPVPFIGKRVYRFIAHRRPVRCEIQAPLATNAGPWHAILQRARQPTKNLSSD